MEDGSSVKWRSIIDDACSYVYSMVKKTDLSNSDIQRLDFLCAVYAYKCYVFCKHNDTSFTAGNLRVNRSYEYKNAEEFWKEKLFECRDLIDNCGFIFGTVKY